MFLDELEIEVRSGAGGNGSVSFRREKYVARGGPDGGDGGDGGSVIFRVHPAYNTLLPLRTRRQYKANKGANGRGSNMTGANGDHLYLEVPKGTIIRDAESGTILGDLIRDHDEMVIIPGGRGGKGNAHFTSSTQRAPRFAQNGEPATSLRLKLELKIMADVGLVGFPNAGKSSLIRSISAARPKVADYPFTTLEPQLGVVAVNEIESFVIADIPGIIRGAHQGHGLGHRFLRHIERTRWLLLLVDPTDPEHPVTETYHVLREELQAFSPTLASKPFSVALTKRDLTLTHDQEREVQELMAELERQAIAVAHISSIKKLGTGPLVQHLYLQVQEQPEIPQAPPSDLPETATDDPLDEL